jgi:hypothetical protein
MAATPDLMFELENAARVDRGLAPRPWGTGPEINARVGELPPLDDGIAAG